MSQYQSPQYPDMPMWACIIERMQGGPFYSLSVMKILKAVPFSLRDLDQVWEQLTLYTTFHPGTSIWLFHRPPESDPIMGQYSIEHVMRLLTEMLQRIRDAS